MRSPVILLLLGFFSQAAAAGPIADRFQDGFNGARWGLSLDALISILPPGDHVFATTPGGRAYWVKDGAPLLETPREGQGTLYGLDENDTLMTVAVGFPYDRKEQLLGALVSAFGAFDKKGTKGTRDWYCWKPDAGIATCFFASRAPKHGVAWLVVKAPNYKGLE